jgi:uncharacterized Zn finger protein (UPF0148 family)
MASKPSQQNKMIATAELLRRGATLMREACPKCGAVQIRFEGRTYCTNEDDLTSLLSPQHEQRLREEGKTASKEKPKTSSEKEDLKVLLEEKLKAVSKQLENSTDPDEQTKLLDLVSKYVETLEKLKKS